MKAGNPRVLLNTGRRMNAEKIYMKSELKPRKIISKSPEETRALAVVLAAELESRGALNSPGVLLALHGELGTGKTCFVQGLAQALGIRQAVASPTYTMINEYRGRRQLAHMDLYRIRAPQELMGIDFESYLDIDGVTVIEWAERAGEWLPDRAMHIYFEAGLDAATRIITMPAGMAA